MLGMGAKAVPLQIPISPNFAGIPPIPSFGNPRRSFPRLSSFRSSRNSSMKVVRSSSVGFGNAEYTEEEEEEPATKVKFQTTLTIPGCSTSLSLLGTGYREKVFAIIGVKVYAAGLYIDESILSNLNAWKGRSLEDIKGDTSLFNTIFQDPIEKSLQIVLVRDVDGKTFWDALNNAISPRLVSPIPIDESALSTFRSFFQGRSLNKGTVIFLTWLNPTKMLVGLSDGGTTTIESSNVAWALFDVFFGKDPVSPSLKDSVAKGLVKLV